MFVFSLAGVETTPRRSPYSSCARFFFFVVVGVFFRFSHVLSLSGNTLEAAGCCEVKGAWGGGRERERETEKDRERG